METKKSSRADLDNRRTQNFLLGVVVAVAALFVALEYRWDVNDGADYETLDEIVKELDLQALKEEEERIPLIKQPVVEIPTSAEKLNVVDEAEELPEEKPLPPPESNAELKLVDEMENPEQPNAVDLEDRPLNYQIVEELPEFPGGAVEFMKWLTKNLRYPSRAQQLKVQGKVITQFIVNKDGSVSDIEIVTSVSPDLDREALRVLRMMPKWKAGQQHQQPCRTVVCIPIVFKL